MKQNITILIQSLKDSPKIISNYISMISEKDLNEKRKDNFWTIKEHLIHLDYVQDILFQRILKFKNEDNPIKKIHEINKNNNYSIIEIGTLEIFGGYKYGNI